MGVSNNVIQYPAHISSPRATARALDEIPATSWSSAFDSDQFGTKFGVIEYLLRSGKQSVDYIWGLLREPTCISGTQQQERELASVATREKKKRRQNHTCFGKDHP